VDGVLTDGGRYFSENKEIFKKFHVRDGMGVNLLLRNGIKSIIITKENSKIVKNWAKEMNIEKTFSGILKKELVLSKIKKEYNLRNDEIAFIGDDVNDLELMKIVGLSATPNDGVDEAKENADYVCKLNGGQGSFRELADMILKIKFPKKLKWY
jgi:3-deoxy-D-manno-octulosonate 8-phosphate phosphatase (KDO 8-P phosphatase)